jgi:hypothetical protein
MIKFFRRIRQDLLSEGKTSKYFKYAIGEIILVMIGILLAVQVNNWNIDRANSILEQKYLNNVKLDLQKDLASLDYQLNFRRKKYLGIEKLITQIKGAPIDDLAELSYNVFNSLMEDRFTPINTTYTELASSGNLNLISNDSIKTLLLELQGLYKHNNFAIEHELYDYREYISKPIFKFTNTDQLFPVYFGEKSIEEQEITKETFKELFNSPEYKNGLTVTNSITKDFIEIYETIQSKSKRIIELINLELKR